MVTLSIKKINENNKLTAKAFRQEVVDNLLESWDPCTVEHGCWSNLQLPTPQRMTGCNFIRCVYKFLLRYSGTFIKNSSRVRKSAVVFVYIGEIFEILGSDDLPPRKRRNSKFNGYQPGSLFKTLALFFICRLALVAGSQISVPLPRCLSEITLWAGF